MNNEEIDNEIDCSDNPVRVLNAIMRDAHPNDPPQLPKELEDYCDELVEFTE